MCRGKGGVSMCRPTRGMTDDLSAQIHTPSTPDPETGRT